MSPPGLDLLPGFAAPVLDAQRGFRAVLAAMSQPGRVQRLALGLAPPAPLGPAAAALLLTLADADTPVWLDAGPAAEHWLRFHAGCPLVASPGAAAFALATGAPPDLATLDAGTEEEPHASATLILQVTALAAEPHDAAPGASIWRLTGPGIEHAHRLAITGLPAGFAAQWAANHAGFPRGIDLILCAGENLAALPRTTRLEPG